MIIVGLTSYVFFLKKDTTMLETQVKVKSAIQKSHTINIDKKSVVLDKPNIEVNQEPLVVSNDEVMTNKGAEPKESLQTITIEEIENDSTLSTDEKEMMIQDKMYFELETNDIVENPMDEEEMSRLIDLDQQNLDNEKGI